MSARLLITGAGGMLGRSLVSAARAAGHPVIALVRGAPDPGWASDAGIRVETLDLGTGAAGAALAPMLEGVAAVIHAAGRMQGSDAEHARDTVGGTEALIGAILAAKAPPRLVLVSSFSVYGYAALPDWATLDERTPTEPDPQCRDAYCRAKLGQERLAIRAAQAQGLAVRLMRVGTLYGPGRVMSARLGQAMGPVFVMPHGRAPVPALHVDDCARALVAAATGAMGPNDLPMPGGRGALDIVNLVAPDAPGQQAWMAAAGQGGRRLLRLPWKPLMRLAKALDLAGGVIPPLGRRLPGLVREPVLAARFKPLRYSCARAEDRLGFRPERDFAAAMAACREAR